MDKKSQINTWYLVLAVIAVLLFQNWWITTREVEVMPYSEFETLLEQGQIAFEQTRRSFLGDGMPDMGPKDYSEETAREIDCAVRELANLARERALSVLRANRAALDAGAERLLETETMLAGDIPGVVMPVDDDAQPDAPGASHI